MKQRLGGILVTALGAALIAGGATASPALDIGASSPCDISSGVITSCPTGTITFDENDVIKQGTAPSPSETPGIRSDAAAARFTSTGPTPPGSWEVTITSPNCSLPSDESSDSVTVPDKGSATSDPLFIYSDTSNNTQCEYDYVETPVDGWTASYDPAPPQTIPYQNQQPAARSGHAKPAATSSNGNLGVALTNTAYVAVSTPTPTSTSPKPHPTASVPTTAPVVTPTPTPSVLGTQQTLPNTGGRHIGAMVWIGSLLVLLGGGLVLAPTIASRRRRTAPPS